MSEITKLHENGLSYITRSGQGPTILFLHGIGSNAASFAPLFGLLPDHLNLLAWNAPGYADSRGLADHWPQPHDYAQALASLLDDIGLPSIYVLGHSLGALIAAEFARSFPDRVAKLVLASAANGYGVPRGAPMPAKTAARIEDIVRLGPAGFARARAPNLVHDPVANKDVVSRIEATMAQLNPAGYVQAVRMLASGDLCTVIRDVQTRPGFIIGAEDRITPPEQTHKAAAAWEARHGSAPQIASIDGAGHAVYAQKPKQFAAALLSLMAPDTETVAPAVT